ncbi:MAG: 3-phosphoserine/phosphohydroxythreonine transaminase [Chloracidobacterium sp.]|nr:3-phosphoserine/phosphohydroxythreonine transaminase [Chloracidobacterium sp.]
MSESVFNFYSGPAILPASVLEKAAAELRDNGGGISVMELSHRSSRFISILRSAEARIRELLAMPENYRVFFLQGGASLQFSMVPMNFLKGGSADHIVTGAWSEKAAARASAFGRAAKIYDNEESGRSAIPSQDELRFSPGASYIHYVSNETIDGVEFGYDLDGFGTHVICDASSNILSRPIDVEKYSMIYAGAQKNLGPSGVTLVMIRDDLLECAQGPSGVLNYKSYLTGDGMPNTPNTWGIYMIDLVCEWLQEKGGLAAAAKRNEEKASLLYSAIDSSDGFYRPKAERNARSKMNVTFRLPTTELEANFCDQAEIAGLIGLRGHRSAGGIRASIYNAFPVEGVRALTEFMDEFARENG